MPPKKKSFRWGHRRTSSTPIQIESRPQLSELAQAAEAAKAAAAAGPRRGPRHEPQVEPTQEEEVEGLNMLTMIAAKDAPLRQASFTNAALPQMMFEPPPGIAVRSPTTQSVSSGPGGLGALGSPVPAEGGALQRTTSDPGTLHQNTNCNEGPKQTLAYWKLEKELRLAQDSLALKQEEVLKMEAYKKSLTEEMDELTTTLFEEAHEMVRVEKEARHKDHVLLEETREQSTVMQEELKSLKRLVASHAKDEKTMTRRASGALLQGVGTDGPAEASWPVDAVLFNEFMKWHIRPSLNANTDYMKRVVGEDMRPCLNFHPKTTLLAKALLHSIKENTLIIEAAPGDAEQVCAFSMAKRACPFRLRAAEPLPEGYESLDNWLPVCTSTRNRVICVCNFYTYARYVVQGIVKANLTVVYWKLNEHRLSINKARLGMPLENV